MGSVLKHTFHIFQGVLCLAFDLFGATTLAYHQVCQSNAHNGAHCRANHRGTSLVGGNHLLHTHHKISPRRYYFAFLPKLYYHKKAIFTIIFVQNVFLLKI